MDFGTSTKYIKIVSVDLVVFLPSIPVQRNKIVILIYISSIFFPTFHFMKTRQEISFSLVSTHYKECRYFFIWKFDLYFSSVGLKYRCLWNLLLRWTIYGFRPVHQIIQGGAITFTSVPESMILPLVSLLNMCLPSILVLAIFHSVHKTHWNNYSSIKILIPYTNKNNCYLHSPHPPVYP